MNKEDRRLGSSTPVQIHREGRVKGNEWVIYGAE